MTNAISLIKRDHRAVEHSYKQYQKEQDSEKGQERKRALAQEILDSLEMHAAMEEKYFYPVLREEDQEQGEGMISEAEGEHKQMKVLIKEAKHAPVGHGLDGKLQELMEIVMHHVKEEESEILPRAEEVLGEERLNELGSEMEPHSPSNPKNKA